MNFSRLNWVFGSGKRASLALCSATGLYLSSVDKETLDIKLASTLRNFRTIKTCTEIVCDYQWSLRSSQQPSVIGMDEYLKNKSACHQRAALRILDLCQQNGGVFIKL